MPLQAAENLSKTYYVEGQEFFSKKKTYGQNFSIWTRLVLFFYFFCLETPAIHHFLVFTVTQYDGKPFSLQMAWHRFDVLMTDVR